MTFFTFGNHHDFAIVALGADTPDPPADSPGLYHVAFKVGDSIDDLRRAKAHFDALGVPIDVIEDHVVAQSIYLHDPDGNAIRCTSVPPTSGASTRELLRASPRLPL